MSSRASCTESSNRDAAFLMTDGGHVLREKLNLGRERQDLRRVVCICESSRSPNFARALCIFATIGLPLVEYRGETCDD
jgi:hypothetical protein